MSSETRFSCADKVCQLKGKILNLELDLTTPQRKVFPRVFVCAASHICYLYDLEEETLCKTYRGHNGPVTCCQVEKLTDQKRHLFTGSWDKTIKKWDIRTGECVETLFGHSDYVRSLLLLQDLGLLVSGSSNGELFVWDLNQTPTKCLHVLKGHTRGVECIVREPGSCVIWTCGGESSIRCWSISRESVQPIDDAFWGHQSNVYSLVFDTMNDGSVWTASADSTVREWSLYPQLREETKLEHSEHCTDVLQWPCSIVVTACRDGSIHLWNGSGGECLRTLHGHSDKVTKLLKWKNLLLSGSLDTTIAIWDVPRILEGRSIVKPTDSNSQNADDILTAEELAELEELMSDE
ncbi:fungal protein [Schizosaccharomyces japonicus yFS275]|uniref:Fungal protein n=1 Tax=Schizosaccharomyces japonicus (strain yFS275 / FY16936) TaxID=402676 RepID=B6JUZ2_SCHJY|nr:fungal protein [Schizosaccharomyces japonicus yFS275]EEB05096.1 fungal protein [Schizosaccharomyces japonicus yFS275]